MPNDLRIEPIRGVWPGELTKPHARASSPFDSTYTATVDLLERELERVGARAVVVQLALSPDEIRLDGRLRANAAPEHPGVILTFTAPKLGSVRFATDRFRHWQANLRAIALGLEALRKIDRYGITGGGEQYAGFNALEASAGAAGFESPEEAARFVVRVALQGEDFTDAKVDTLADAILVDDELGAIYYRRASKLAHPDAGGSEELMARLNAARAMLETPNQGGQ